ncbi:MAG: YkgJ family cysteine cluster protein [Crocinitomicaceae bacterium]|nr:YkgJ family cysteine cluster protein [Crocinitomicaceae bacterium]
MEYQSYFELAQENIAKITATFKRLKKKKPKNLDELFQDAHEEAFNEIDCLKCANCCKTTSPIFRDIDVKRISKKMKVSVRDFENQYLRRDEDSDWVLKTAPCSFLHDDNSCGIYDYRPQACRDYPHTDQRKVVQVLDLTLKNTEICPAAAKISVEITRNIR